MKRTKVITTFEGGQADAQFARRTHEEVAGATVKKLRNMRIRNGGSIRRRPGTLHKRTLVGSPRCISFRASDGTWMILVFSNQRVDILSEDGGSLLQTLTAQVWASSDLASLQFGFDKDKIIVSSNVFLPREMTYDTSGATWASNSFSFLISGDGRSGQPYFRYADRGITLTPSSTTGAVTVTASSSVFTAAYVSYRIRIMEKEIALSGYTSGTQVNGTWVQTGMPTLRLTVPSTAIFSPGDICQFSVTKYRCEVFQIVSGTQLDVLMIDSYVGPTTGTDYLIGPNGTTTAAISASAAAPANAATAQWDEPMMSAVRGFPEGAVVHGGRLFFYDFPQAPSYFAASAVGALNDFDVGDATDDDAIIDGLGVDPGTRIRRMVSHEQLIALTDAGAFYLNEAVGVPITPTTIGFSLITPEPHGDCAPAVASEGVIYAETNADRIIVVAPTGDTSRKWQPDELGEMAQSIINDPVRLVYIDGSDFGPERYLVSVNGDGTLGVMHYQRAASTVGWASWDTDGEIVDMFTLKAYVFCVVERDGVYSLERFSQNLIVDDAVLLSNPAATVPAFGSYYANKDLTVIWRKVVDGDLRRGYMGVFTADGSGDISALGTDERDYEAGHDFTVEIEPWEPYDPVSHTLRATRISQIAVDLLDSGCALVDGGNRLSPYRMADDVTEPPPLRTGTRKKKLLGRRSDLTKSITQTEAAPLEIRSITMVVS